MDVKQAVNIAAEYVAEMEQLTRLKDARNKGDDLQFLKQLHFLLREPSLTIAIKLGLLKWDLLGHGIKRHRTRF